MGKVIGSAADAQHLATELVVRYKKRKAIPAVALTTDTSILTAVEMILILKKFFKTNRSYR